MPYFLQRKWFDRTATATDFACAISRSGFHLQRQGFESDWRIDANHECDIFVERKKKSHISLIIERAAMGFSKCCPALCR